MMKFAIARRGTGIAVWPGCLRMLFAVAFVAAFSSTGPVFASALTTDPFVLVPEFGDGTLMPDTFASNLVANTGSIGRSVEPAHTDVHAQFALVKNPTGSQTNGFWNIGIVQYDAYTGSAVPWSNPSPEYVLPGDIHVVYPRSDSARFTHLAATERLFNDYYVLTEVSTAGTADWRQGMVLKFNTPGRYIGRASVSAQLDDTRMADMAVVGEQPAGHPVFVEGYGLVAVGTRFVNGRGNVVLNQINPEGPGGLPFAGTPIPITLPHCDAAMDCRAEVVVASRETVEGGGTGYRLYIGARTRVPGSANWDTLIIKTDADGNVLGSRWIDFRHDRAERPVQIIAGVAKVFLVAEVEQSCHDGVVVARFSPDLANLEAFTFFGGQHSTVVPPVCHVPGNPLYPRSARIGIGPNGSGRLMIVGRSDRVTASGPTRLGGFVASIDEDLNLRGVTHFESPDLLGFPTNAVFNQLRQYWGGATGSWAEVVGDMRFLNHGSVPANLRDKVTSMRAAVRSDRIFGDGFRRCNGVPGC